MQLLALILSLAALSTAPSKAQAPSAPDTDHVTINRNGVVMGAPWDLSVTGQDRVQALEASETVVRSLAASEQRLSNWIADSELSRWNRCPTGTPLPCSPALAHAISRADHWRGWTEGAFSPLSESLVEVWDLRGAGRIPDPQELARALKTCDPGLLTWRAGQPIRGTLARIASGGFGKGAALDSALSDLHPTESFSVTINLGGQVLVNGRSQWVDVAHPLHRAESIARWWITTGSLATSGNSERGRTIDGIRIGHVLDARTGQPAEDFGSVTVWCDNALDADCLSTALFALGPEKGLQLAATLPNVRALFAVHQGDGVQLRATSNCRPFLRSQQTILWFPEPQANDPVPEETENKTR